MLHWYGYNLTLSWVDSLVSNGLLAGSVLIVANVLKFFVPERNRYLYIFSLCLVMSVIWLLITRTVLFVFLPADAAYQRFFALSVPIRLTIAFLLVGCTALISVLWYLLQDQQEMAKRKNEAEKLSREAELFRLRQQLQPHFLFNSLNSINALIGFQPAQARVMIQQLSDFLRGTLKKEEDQWISLQEELQHLQLYLDIEKVRFGHRLNTVITTQPGIENALLPAMLLQPVMENAIKFGLYDITGDITISLAATQVDNHLLIDVTNPFDPRLSPPKGTGFGLSSVARRLNLLFERNDLLLTTKEVARFVTTIKIPQIYDQSHHH
jgi:two-component system, LytTR family, sensor kinase